MGKQATEFVRSSVFRENLVSEKTYYSSVFKNYLKHFINMNSHFVRQFKTSEKGTSRVIRHKHNAMQHKYSPFRCHTTNERTGTTTTNTHTEANSNSHNKGTAAPNEQPNLRIHCNAITYKTIR